MMIETDMLYAQVKSDDWLKPTAEKLMQRIVRGEFGIVVSREVRQRHWIKRMDPRTL